MCKEFVKDNCKVFELDGWCDICAETKEQAIAWYLENFEPEDEENIRCEDIDSSGVYWTESDEDSEEFHEEIKTFKEGIDEAFDKHVITEPFVLALDW